MVKRGFLNNFYIGGEERETLSLQRYFSGFIGKTRLRGGVGSDDLCFRKSSWQIQRSQMNVFHIKYFLKGAEIVATNFNGSSLLKWFPFILLPWFSSSGAFNKGTNALDLSWIFFFFGVGLFDLVRKMQFFFQSGLVNTFFWFATRFVATCNFSC